MGNYRSYLLDRWKIERPRMCKMRITFLGRKTDLKFVMFPMKVVAE